MLNNYLKIAWRNLVRNKTFSSITVLGLALGMAVTTLIGLWINDELLVNTYHQNYDRIVQVMRTQTVNGQVETQENVPIPLANTLTKEYGSDFRQVVLAWWTTRHTLALKEQVFSKSGKFMTPGAPHLLSLKMVKGSRDGLQEPASIVLSESTAKALFGERNPLHQTLTIDNTMTVNVTGVYEDIPAGNRFADVQFIAPWDLYAASTTWVNESKDDWTQTSFELFAQLAHPVEAEDVSAKIQHLLADKSQIDPAMKPTLVLYPMSRWHLYSEWENGINVGGRIQFVWLFGLVAVFVLLLACINFMNLNTAQSINRAKEVGIRKAVGSGKRELFLQFMGESLLVVGVAYLLSLLFITIAVPFFNHLADKHIGIPWDRAGFWGMGLGFTLLTGLLAGSYPAFYLSSFRPIAVLKGPQRFPISYRALTPRRTLVVLQFTVSITLIIGTIVVYKQIRYAQERPIGYDRNGLVSLLLNTPDYQQHREALRETLLKTKAVVDMGESASPLTETRSANSGFDWPGKNPTLQVNFGTVNVSHGFGKTVGWQFKQGRDFSRQLASDSSGLIVNESAARFIGLPSLIGQAITWSGPNFTVKFRVIGIVKDMVMDSPYEPVKPTVFFIGKQAPKFLTMRLNPHQSASASLKLIGQGLKEHLPEAAFTYTFVDDDHNEKFRSEERIGHLAGIFAGLAILISCLGLFGLATFTAEQRTKEIGVRKVLGASVGSIVTLLSKDFLKLVLIALMLASPLAWYAMNHWLQRFAYKVDMAWWMFALAGLLAVTIALLTVSFQTVKAALKNPVSSLRSE
ncbi:MAG: FtsX-like permease family protein [Cytophagales bacterium]|nr:MAG: FtsX-like permease family protein [Cytophagales bacterium]